MNKASKKQLNLSVLKDMSSRYNNANTSLEAKYAAERVMEMIDDIIARLENNA